VTWLRGLAGEEILGTARRSIRRPDRVDDIAAAVERVRVAGGRADEPERKPYGLLAECIDEQGTAFRLWQPAD
jgi:hypothetical protein